MRGSMGDCEDGCNGANTPIPSLADRSGPGSESQPAAQLAESSQSSSEAAETDEHAEVECYFAVVCKGEGRELTEEDRHQNACNALAEKCIRKRSTLPASAKTPTSR